MVNIPLGEGGYALSWIEAIGTVFWLIVHLVRQPKKIVNYLFGLINVTLFAAIFFRFSMPACYFRYFLCGEYLRLVRMEPANDARKSRCRKYAGFLVNKHGGWGHMYYRHSADGGGFYQSVFAMLTRVMLALLQR